MHNEITTYFTVSPLSLQGEIRGTAVCLCVRACVGVQMHVCIVHVCFVGRSNKAAG